MDSSITQIRGNHVLFQAKIAGSLLQKFSGMPDYLPHNQVQTLNPHQFQGLTYLPAGNLHTYLCSMGNHWFYY
jgi:hypothetical protein